MEKNWRKKKREENTKAERMVIARRPTVRERYSPVIVRAGRVLAKRWIS